MKFERLDASYISICLHQLVNLSVKLCRRTSFSLRFAESFIFLAWFFFSPLVLFVALDHNVLPAASKPLPISRGVVGWSGAAEL